MNDREETSGSPWIDRWTGAAPLLKYGIVGSIAFVIDYSVTALCVRIFPLLIANTLGFTVANIANFLMAHTWVFAGRHAFRSLWHAYLAVLSISIVGLAINDAVVWTLVEVLGLSLFPAKVGATIVVLFWNYFARVAIVYKKPG